MLTGPGRPRTPAQMAMRLCVWYQPIHTSKADVMVLATLNACTHARGIPKALVTPVHGCHLHKFSTQRPGANRQWPWRSMLTRTRRHQFRSMIAGHPTVGVIHWCYQCQRPGGVSPGLHNHQWASSTGGCDSVDCQQADKL